jgi:cytoskeletal protein RodZ
LNAVNFLRLFLAGASVLSLALVVAAQSSPTKSPAKKTTAAGPNTAPAAKKPAATKTAKKGTSTAARKTTTTKKRTASASKKTAKAPVKRPVGQQRPTAERYKEIETALYERGYLMETPSGAWTPASAEALSRFQADEDLPPTGKLDALSLIRLGLGPQQP